jgi:small ligand-binding sensory domain FIST
MLIARTAMLITMLAATSTPGVAQTAPATPALEFAFEETVTLGAEIAVGKTAQGERIIIPITGGTFSGPGIKGTILSGGWDWQLVRADGCRQIKADYMLLTDDGVVINVVNTGALCGGKGPVRAFRTQPVFEAPLGKYQWLSQNAFIGTLDPAKQADGKPAVHIRFYKVN